MLQPVPVPVKPKENRMHTFKKILVATDFSPQAAATYPTAQKLASVFKSKVDLIHIVPMLKYLNESIKKLGTPLDLSDEIYPKIMEESNRELQKLGKEHIKKGNKGKTYVKVDRKPWQAIIDHAVEGEYDLIIMGARGAHKSRMIRGSTTDKVIRNSTVPVFCIDASFEGSAVETILVPTDGSPFSFAAFPPAVALADLFGASITLFHVLELYGSYTGHLPLDRDVGENVSIYEELIKNLNTWLADNDFDPLHVQRSGVVFEDQLTITTDEESRTVPVRTVIEKGISAHFEIERYSEENADLVVIATHGHSGLAHLVLGSTAEKVAQYVSKPVLTVRPDKKAFEKKK